MAISLQDKAKLAIRKILKVVVIIIVMTAALLMLVKMWTEYNGIGHVRYGDDISVANLYGYLCVLRLNDEEVLILGSDFYDYANLDGKKLRKYRMPLKYIPAEIYNIKNRTHRIINPAENLIYYPEGIMLGNERLLLYYATKEKLLGNEDITTFSLPFSELKTMILTDIKENKVINMYDKKINKTHVPSRYNTTFTLLNNGNVLIIDFEHNLAEIYNPDKNDSDLIKFPYNKSKISPNVVVPFKQNKAIIFGQTDGNFNDSDSVIEYDDSTKTFKEAGMVMRRTNPYVVPLKDGKFLLVGGEIYKAGGGVNWNVQEIEIYDANTGTARKINKLPYSLKYDYNSHRNSFAIAKISDRYVLITGGKQGSYEFPKILNKSLIIDTEENKIKKGLKLKYPTYTHKMLKVNDNEVLIIDETLKTQIYTIK